MTELQNVELVQELYAAFGRGDDAPWIAYGKDKGKGKGKSRDPDSSSSSAKDAGADEKERVTSLPHNAKHAPPKEWFDKSGEMNVKAFKSGTKTG